MTDNVKLPNEIRAVMDNGIPAVVVTCSSDGIPNATIISHVHYMDESHVALSFQFFNKTIRNVRENPHACVSLNDLKTSSQWILDVRYDHSGPKAPSLTRWTCASKPSPRRQEWRVFSNCGPRMFIE